MEPLLADLPADVLLMVMKFLEVPDLLACRLVCKRLGGLALHPDAWRRRNVTVSRQEVQALRLAPCLTTWKLNLTHEMSHPPLALCSTTKCAVTHLEMMVSETKDWAEFKHAGPVIRNQAALGRLRRLKLWGGASYFVPEDMDAKLLATAVSAAGLEELDIGSFDMLPNPAAPALLTRAAGAAPSPSIKTLLAKLNPATEPFVSFVLAAHAATLETVSLPRWSETSDFIAAQLGGLANLRELTCNLPLGLQALAACQSLRKVSLYVRGRERVLLDECLGRAGQLESLSLFYESVDKDDGPFVLSLPSRLQFLEITEFTERERSYRHLQPLLAALPSLAYLHHLELSAVVLDGLAGAVTPVTAPALRTLRLQPKIRDQCGHAYLHSRSMATLLADNPALQVHVRCLNVCLEVDTCEACRRHCHQELRCIRLIRRLMKGVRLSYGYGRLRIFPKNLMWINITKYNLLFNNSSQSPLIPVG
ncbi:uncharacterized protein LOC127751807 [Frankliniella occidentalis]|uniref:Uncharacterized protein LOC127751807 n=1 Tax=Frankliniella occidentalis TaxID=133901 RepID=A0A9C6X9U7_FRAOC|nr:uncharacterized protein LOC127751807 [Frankliniella occidentalis]XP_052131855.1 uncharacterized protein LOC127751807 [Frankliniella occidentalis]